MSASEARSEPQASGVTTVVSGQGQPRSSSPIRSWPLRAIGAWLLALGLLISTGALAQDEAGDDSCVGKGRLRLGWAPGAWQIPEGAGVELDFAAQKILRDCGGKKIVVEGHTDIIGRPEYNLALSQKRAEAVKAALVERGVPADQLEVQAFGESRPITREPGQQALNRRVTLVAP